MTKIETIEAFKASIAEATDEEIELVLFAMSRIAQQSSTKQLRANLTLMRRMETHTGEKNSLLDMLELIINAAEATEAAT